MKTIQTRTATDGLRYARTAERALQIARDGYTFWPDAELETIFVCKPGNLHSSYEIDTRAQTCTCPDFSRRGDYCKHLLAVDYQRQEEAQVAEYEQRMMDAECSTGCDAYAEY